MNHITILVREEDVLQRFIYQTSIQEIWVQISIVPQNLILSQSQLEIVQFQIRIK